MKSVNRGSSVTADQVTERRDERLNSWGNQGLNYGTPVSKRRNHNLNEEGKEEGRICAIARNREAVRTGKNGQRR